jgi:hypothetical protein
MRAASSALLLLTPQDIDASAALRYAIGRAKYVDGMVDGYGAPDLEKLDRVLEATADLPGVFLQGQASVPCSFDATLVSDLPSAPLFPLRAHWQPGSGFAMHIDEDWRATGVPMLEAAEPRLDLVLPLRVPPEGETPEAQELDRMLRCSQRQTDRRFKDRVGFRWRPWFTATVKQVKGDMTPQWLVRYAATFDAPAEAVQTPLEPFKKPVSIHLGYLGQDVAPGGFAGFYAVLTAKKPAR